MMDMTLTLPGELTLLALDGETGRSRVESMDLDALLAGAVLTELVLRDRITLDGRRVCGAEAVPTGEPLLDDALARVARERRSRTLDWWVAHLRKGLGRQVLDDLVARGLVRMESRRMFGIFPATRVPETDGVAEELIRTRLNMVVLDGVDPDPRTAALAALLTAPLARRVWSAADIKAARARLRALAQRDTVAASVRRAIETAQTALLVVAGAAAVGATMTA